MENWRRIQKANFSSWEKLADFLNLDEEKRKKILPFSSFPLNVPFRLAQKMEKNSLEDPLFLQFVPLKVESKPGFMQDPVNDLSFQENPKLLHKYQGRVLLLVSGACAMNCRFCFRQNFPYETEQKQFQKELEYIKNEPSLHEVILSGGDPLSISNTNLEMLIKELAAIPHIELIRFHTRFPIGIPERIDDAFVKILSDCKKQIIFILHVNHSNELDENLFSHLKKLTVPILTHTVLLKGVNDNIKTLQTLFLNLVKRGIFPYYLNQLDLVSGSERFFVDIKTGLVLMQALRESLPGYAVPRYAQEIPFKKSKTQLI